MSYLKRDNPEFNFLKHIVLLYNDGKEPWTKEALKYYVAHLGNDHIPNDWLFDSFLFINTKSQSGKDYLADVNLGKTMAGEGDFFAVCSPNPATKEDWDELLDSYFSATGALHTLDETIEDVSARIGHPKHLRNVVLALPYPHITQEAFGELAPGDGGLNFSVKGQDLAHATASRLKAEVWLVDKIREMWNEQHFHNLNLLGVYWIFESVYRSWEIDDHFLLKELRKHVNVLGLKFFWIPFYATYNFHLLENYKAYYFDAAFLQPNFLFYKTGKYIETAARVARESGAGIEMEYYLDLNEPISIKGEKHIRFREYLNDGVRYGYMTESACAHFQGVGALQKMHSHSDRLEQEFYEDIYHFVKGDYEIKPYPQSPPQSSFIPKRTAALAMDLGGTNLRAAVVDEAGKIVHWKQCQTPSSRQGIIKSMVEQANDLLALADSDGLKVTGVGISTGGRVDFERGVVSQATSLISDWNNVPLRAIIEEHLKIPTVVDNDGNCSAVAEKVFGRAKSADNFISIVLGTGIGGGIYVQGRLLRGESNYTSEIGHISVASDGPKCNCGNYGCVELYASGSGLVRWARETSSSLLGVKDNQELTAKDIAELARSGNPAATKLLQSAGEKLGTAVAGLVDVFNPSLIIFSGSLIGLGELYFDAFNKTLTERAIKPTADGLQVMFSDFPQEAGIIGAAALAFQHSMQDLSGHETNVDGSDGVHIVGEKLESLR